MGFATSTLWRACRLARNASAGRWCHRRRSGRRRPAAPPLPASPALRSSAPAAGPLPAAGARLLFRSPLLFQAIPVHLGALVVATERRWGPATHAALLAGAPPSRLLCSQRVALLADRLPSTILCAPCLGFPATTVSGPALRLGELREGNVTMKCSSGRVHCASVQGGSGRAAKLL